MRRYWFVPLWTFRSYVRVSAWKLRRELRRDNATLEQLAELDAFKHDALAKWGGRRRK